MKCPHCSQPHPPAAAFCPTTGKALPRPQAMGLRAPLLAGFAGLGVAGCLALCAGAFLLIDFSTLELPSLPSPPNATTVIVQAPQFAADTSTVYISPTLQATATRAFTATSTATRTPRPTDTQLPTPTRSPTPAPTATYVAGCAITVTGRYASLWVQYRDQLGCPYTAAEHTIPTVAEQPFQNGHLFWRSDLDRYYAVYDSGGATTGAWASYGNKPGSAQNCAAHSPPPGYFKPIRGFGDIWCFLGGANSALGWAWAPEGGFVAGQGDNVQDFEKGVIFQDSDGVTRNLVYVLTGEGFYRVTP